jgi:16S rRNA (guanine527-N7)-methyltransferase
MVVADGNLRGIMCQDRAVMASPARPCYAGRMSAPPLSSDTEARLRAYAELLASWTRRINLVSAADQASLWTRHVQDSLRLAPLVPPGTPRAIDLGSGGGLPGLVLAIATAVPFDLVEADRRKCAFLMEAARLTRAPVRVHTARIESCVLEPAPLITARALAPLPALLALAAPLLAPGGVLLLPKGARSGEELAAARETWSFTLDTEGPPDTPILIIRHPARKVPAHV